MVVSIKLLKIWLYSLNFLEKGTELIEDCAMHSAVSRLRLQQKTLQIHSSFELIFLKFNKPAFLIFCINDTLTQVQYK